LKVVETGHVERREICQEKVTAWKILNKLRQVEVSVANGKSVAQVILGTDVAPVFDPVGR